MRAWAAFGAGVVTGVAALAGGLIALLRWAGSDERRE